MRMLDPTFWAGRRVFLTGNTGFKGSWMTLLLKRLGADVYGYALPPNSERDLFVAAEVDRDVHYTVGDVRHIYHLEEAMAAARPDVVIHMAAQPLVHRSYRDPIETYTTNVMGTVNLLETVRHQDGVKAVVVVTSDKCYENAGGTREFWETDTFGGHDPYSSSKGCAEIVTASFRRSYFTTDGTAAVASARAGNVIGGGDRSMDRLIPDAIRAFEAGESLRIRYPDAVRPWQHVFDPVVAYLMLAQRLVEDGKVVAEGWNIGPPAASEVPVSTVVDLAVRFWGGSASWSLDRQEHPYEAGYLKLNSDKARRLGWRSLFDLEEAVRLTIEWYRAASNNQNMRKVSLRQLDAVLAAETD